MRALFPAIIYAIVAGIPGFWLGSLIAAPRFRERPTREIVTTLIRSTPVYFLMFGVPALLYGSAVWWVLNALGFLNLASLLSAATLPVLGYLANGIAKSGWDPRLRWGVWAFWLPPLFIAVALWWFGVYAVGEA